MTKKRKPKVTKIKSNVNRKNQMKPKHNVDKQEWTCPVCNGAWEENQIHWNVCRIHIVRARRYTWCEIIHKENKSSNTAIMFLDIYR